MQRRPNQRHPRRGAAAVEFAFVAPVLLLLIFAMIEFGRMFMVQQVMTNASREGARQAILEHATSQQVESIVHEYLAGSSVTGARVSVSPSLLSSAEFGEPVTVRITVPYDSVSWVPPWFLGGKSLNAQTVMRSERRH